MTRALRVRTWLRTRTPRQILLAGFAVFVLYGFPGYMSTDSAQQLAEARTGHLGDAHPPIMAKEWAFLDHLVSGPLLMLLLQGTLFLGGLYVILRRLLDPRRAAWVAIGILLFPPVLTPMAVIWKDSQMAAYLVAGIAAMLQPRLRTRVVGLALLVVACALRHNAFAAVVPLVFFVFEWRAGMRWWKRVAVLTATAVIAIGAAFAITRAVTVEHVKLTPAFQDIVGVLAFTGDRSDADLEHVLRGTSLVVHERIQGRARYLFARGGAWRVAGGDDRMFDAPKTQAEWDALSRAWQELVLGDPGAYLESHWVRFEDLIGYWEPPRASVWNLFLEDRHHRDIILHEASASSIQAELGRAFWWLSDETPLFEPWIYGVVALLLLVLCCRDRLTAGLFTSGLLYELSFFPVGVDPDYRYSHWLITCVVLAVVILTIQRSRRPA